jgi:V/A-type H+-transporting ATPase subunit A
MTCYSGDADLIDKWWVDNVDKDRPNLRLETYSILRKEDVLKEIVRLLGPEALPDEEKLILDVARMIKEGFLQQMAFDKVDTYCSPKKQVKMMRTYNDFYKEASNALKRGVPLDEIRSLSVVPEIIRSKYEIKDEELDKLDELHNKTIKTLKSLSTSEVSVTAK